MLSIVLPTGSMEEATLKLFEGAYLKVIRSSDRSYAGIINDPRFEMVKFLRPQDIPRYIARGNFDLGISGQDWIKENQVEGQVIEICTLPLSKSGVGKVKIVLAVNQQSDIKRLSDLTPSCIVETEYPEITKAYLKERGLTPQIVLSHGTTEAKVSDICSAIVELFETGKSFTENNLRIIEVIMESKACLIANPESYKKSEKQINEIRALLLGAVLARDKVHLTFHLPENKLEEAEGFLPALKKPTISQLHSQTDWLSVSVVVFKERTEEHEGVSTIISRLKDLGATDILAWPVNIAVI